MMTEISIRSKFFGLLTDSVAYKETLEGDDFEPADIHPSDDLFADMNEKVRKLNGKNVTAVVFSVGDRGNYWMPSRDFYRLTKGIDPSKRTNKPFNE